MTDFVGVGAQKAGTSWLYACLYEHPEIHAPIKEIHFFGRNKFDTMGIEWYRNMFRSAQGKLCGEFSTSYLENSEIAAGQIHSMNPQAKIIMSVRNPVDRAFSNYTNDLTSGAVAKEIEFFTAMKRNPKYIDRGLYGKHLECFLQFFPRKQIHIIDFHEISTDPTSVIGQLYKFLGVKDTFRPWALQKKINKVHVPKHIWLDKLIVQCAAFLTDKKLHQLRWAIRKTGVTDVIRSLNSASFKQPSVYEKAGVNFHDYFADDINKFENLSQMDVSNWLK